MDKNSTALIERGADEGIRLCEVLQDVFVRVVIEPHMDMLILLEMASLVYVKVQDRDNVGYLSRFEKVFSLVKGMKAANIYTARAWDQIQPSHRKGLRPLRILLATMHMDRRLKAV